MDSHEYDFQKGNLGGFFLLDLLNVGIKLSSTHSSQLDSKKILTKISIK